MVTNGPSGINPWKRRKVCEREADDLEESFSDGCVKKRGRCYQHLGATELDVDTKRAALKIAPSVVGLISYSGEKELCEGCGTITEIDNGITTLITCANMIRRPTNDFIGENSLADNLKVHVIVADGKSYKGEIVAYDFHYNILVLRFQSATPLRAASFARINDSLSLRVTEKRPFEIRPHSVKLVPGVAVVAVGRHVESPFDIVVVPGVFSMDRCLLDCKELCLATCIITRWTEGSPLINLSGEVIGITYYDTSAGAPFLPINIVLKWWDHYKNHGTCCHPSLGFEATNLYAAELHIIERVLKTFPDIHNGVIVEKVIPGSSSQSSGLRQDDIIVSVGNRTVQSFFELLDIWWGKIGDTVEVVVARANHDTLIHLNMIVAEAQPEELNSWPHWTE